MTTLTAARGRRGDPDANIVMDADAAGREATSRLVEAFGAREVPVTLPHGIKDPADLARRSDGDKLFASAINEASARTARV